MEQRVNLQKILRSVRLQRIMQFLHQSHSMQYPLGGLIVGNNLCAIVATIITQPILHAASVQLVVILDIYLRLVVANAKLPLLKRALAIQLEHVSIVVI